MSTEQISLSIDNIISALKLCAGNDVQLKHIYININLILDEHITENNVPTIIHDDSSRLYYLLYKAIIIARYIEKFQNYVRVYKKDKDDNITSCMATIYYHLNNIKYNIEIALIKIKSH
jgi:hypothetical protein